MELRKECIGLELGCKFERLIKIENDPKKFKLYKELGLDVFKKKDVIKEGNSKRKNRTNSNREDNDK